MENACIYLIKASGLIALFYLAYMLLLRKETFFTTNRWFLILGLITSALLPLFFITKIIWIEPTTEVLDWSNLPVATSPEKEEIKINWYQIAAYFYLAGITIAALKLILDFKSLSKVLKGKTIQLQENFKLIDVTENIAPFSYFKNIVYNSSLYSTIELENILAHEKVHSRQNHTIDVLLSRLFCVLFWFNPLIWLYQKAMVQNLEFIADNEAAKKITDKKAYQFTLLKITTHKNCVPITNHFYQSLIKKRIIMLNKNQSNKWNSWKYVSVFPALAAFVFLFQIEVVAQEKETSKQENENKSTILVTTKENPNKDSIFNNDKKPLIILDGHRNHKLKVEDIQNIDPNSIEQITVLKDGNATNKYGKEGKNGVIEIITKEKIEKNGFSTKGYKLKAPKQDKKPVIEVHGFRAESLSINSDQKKVIFNSKNIDQEKILVIVDGKKTKTAVEDLNPDSIESINVLKDKSAEDKYGKEGKNGVIEITTKEKAAINKSQTVKNRTVQGFQLLKFNDKKDVVADKIDFIITKSTTDEEIKEKCEQIKNKHNIDLTFFNIKRNSNGEIINIESKYESRTGSNSGKFTASKKPIEPFKFYSKKNTNGGYTIGYATLSNSISRIIENKTIDYKKAVIIIDGKQSDYQDLEKVNPSEVKRVITQDIKSKSSEAKKYFELYGEKALYGFLIEIQTNEYYNKNN